LNSGFEAQSTNRASVQLDQPQGLGLKNGTSGQLVGSVTPVKNANMYEGRIKIEGGDWLPSVFTGDWHRIIFEGLTPAKNYAAQVRALGGSTGQSDWSDPSSHMAMYWVRRHPYIERQIVRSITLDASRTRDYSQAQTNR